MNHHSVKYGTVACILGVALIAGCGYTVKPGNLSIGGDRAASLSGASVLLVNVEQNAGKTAISRDTQAGSGLLANRYVWSKKLVESLAISLARRGAQVRANAKQVLSISLPDVVFHEDRESAQFTVKMLVSSSTGWTKTYEGVAKTDVLRAPKETDQLALQALNDTARAMLGDSEFQEQLLKR